MTATCPRRPFTLRAVSGFFVQGDDGVQDPPHYAPHLGLHLDKKWTDVDARLDETKSKLIILLRHGEGIHNADKARVGEKAWEDKYQFLPVYMDAPLTETGTQQATDAGRALKTEITDRGLTLDLVVVSPLDRTLHTYATAFKDIELAAPVVAMELTRETLGVCPCDQRKPIGPKREAFPHIHFDSIKTDEDPWWTPTHRETDVEIEDRARRFLHHLFHERDERRIAVVSHNGFSRACLRVLGHRYYRPCNGEFIPVIIQDDHTIHSNA